MSDLFVFVISIKLESIAIVSMLLSFFELFVFGLSIELIILMSSQLFVVVTSISLESIKADEGLVIFEFFALLFDFFELIIKRFLLL
jgi:hypothetical protein